MASGYELKVEDFIVGNFPENVGSYIIPGRLRRTLTRFFYHGTDAAFSGCDMDFDLALKLYLID